jgi:cell division transport system ATP-binding protein
VEDERATLVQKGAPVIQLSSVAYSYGADALLRDVTLSLAPGSFHFLTGPSGAGKSTLLKLCYMELRATEGQVQVFGKDVAGMDRDAIARARRRIGIVHQDCQFLDHLSLADNVALPLEVAGQDPAPEAQNLSDLLSWVGLGARAHARPPELSGGERQRAALARAVIMGPDIILADEPTGNVDWEMSLRLLQLLTELNRMGKAVLIATHDLGLIRAAKAQVAARVLRIADRQVHLAGADL